MIQFFIWFFILLFFTGAAIISGYKTKETWDIWHRNESSRPVRENVNVTSFSQSGGITANTVNLKPVPRVFNENYARELDKVLPSDKSKKIQLEVIGNDAEALNFVMQIKNFLIKEGYTNVSDEPDICLMPVSPIEKQEVAEKDTEFIIRIGHNE